MPDGSSTVLVRLSNLTVSDDKGSRTELAVLAGSHFVMLDERVRASRSIARIIAGLESPQAGSCTVGRRQLDVALPEARRSVGYVPNPPVVLRGLSLLRFLRLASDSYGLQHRDREATIEQVAEWCDLSEHLHLPLEELDRTELYMASFAAALLHHPSVLILEGPLPQQVTDRLPSLRQAGKAIISSAVSVAEVPRTADRIGLCDASGIAVTTTVGELLEACRKLCMLEVSFQPRLSRDQLEAIPSVQQVVSTRSGFRLGVSSLEAALVAIVNTARANARRIVELGTASPSVDQLINYFDYLRFPEDGTLFEGERAGRT
ncbi:hypothetical protein JW921_04810 [Candidatus Fermentibacterales bacterium]|nr:hypothetical protein [Candidatus Fermentibacterales bacterium]